MTAGRTQNTLSTSWCTPMKYVQSINQFYNNNIELDPCSNDDSIVNAKVKYIYPINDGLKDSWDYKNIFVNPPCGRDKDHKTSIKDWLKRCYESSLNESEVLALIPVATNTSHWKEYIFNKATGICFLSDTRLKFRIDGNENNKGCPVACCMVYWGNYFERFKDIFGTYGAVISL